MRVAPTILTVLALGAGFGMWAFSHHQLASAGATRSLPNPFGIKQSPYGAVLAMGLQGPLDIDWHAMEGGHVHDEHCEECEEHDAAEAAADKHRSSVGRLIAKAQKAVDERTNPNPPNALLKYYLRREMGNKLRFAYELDPAHYANYNIYNLFLTISSLNTRHATEKDALHLADLTINYCLAQPNDPRPALTAASAATNALVITMRQDSQYPPQVGQHYFEVLNQAINRYENLLMAWQADGTWSNLSEIRRDEANEHYRFNRRVRDDTQMLLNRLNSDSQAAPSNP